MIMIMIIRRQLLLFTDHSGLVATCLLVVCEVPVVFIMTATAIYIYMHIYSYALTSFHHL